MLHVAFPMPAEDPGFSLNRVAWLLGRTGLSAFESVHWGIAAQCGVTLTAELDVAATRSVHALIKVLDSNHCTAGQAVVCLPLPWLSHDETPPSLSHPYDHSGGTRHTSSFEADLVHRGQRVGTLRGQMTAAFAVSAAPASQGWRSTILHRLESVIDRRRAESSDGALASERFSSRCHEESQRSYRE